MDEIDLVVYQQLYDFKRRKGRITKDEARFVKKHTATNMPLALCVYGMYLLNSAHNTEEELIALEYLRKAFLLGDDQIKESVFKVIDERFTKLRRDDFLHNLS